MMKRTKAKTVKNAKLKLYIRVSDM